MNINEALREVAKQDAAAGASPTVEARLLQEVRAIARAHRRRTAIAVLATAAVFAAAIYLPLQLGMWRTAVSDRPVRTEVTTEFFPLMYSSLPISGGQIVRLSVPERALASFGLAVPSALDSSRTVLADVLVGDDGLARFVRFVRSTNHQE